MYLALERQWLTHSSWWLNSRQKTERNGEWKKKRKRNDERTEEEGGEGDHVKKSSSFVCQSFYDDKVVIRIYIHYKASECMTWMYLHFNSKRTRNLFCTIDLMMWLYIVSLLVHSSWTYVLSFFFICLFYSVFCFFNTIHHQCRTRQREKRGITIIIRYTCITIYIVTFSLSLSLSRFFFQQIELQTKERVQMKNDRIFDWLLSITRFEQVERRLDFWIIDMYVSLGSRVICDGVFI